MNTGNKYLVKYNMAETSIAVEYVINLYHFFDEAFCLNSSPMLACFCTSMIYLQICCVQVEAERSIQMICSCNTPEGPNSECISFYNYTKQALDLATRLAFPFRNQPSISGSLCLRITSDDSPATLSTNMPITNTQEKVLDATFKDCATS